MTPGADDEDAGGLPDDADLGEPVAILRGASVALDEQFEQRVRDRIERRLLGGDIIELFWTAPSAILLGLLSRPIDILGERHE